MATVKNPILPGFHADPAIIRVGEEYYIATSTFEWYPGVQLHRSRDLAHWELLPRPLSRSNQLHMSGAPSSAGVWAPDISYHDGTFYLIYTDVKTGNGGRTFYDVRNFLVTTQDLYGEWSEPIYLNGSGFDPAMFHDDDGRSYLVNMQFDYRPWNIRFAGIVMQEYSKEEGKLIGEPKNIFAGTSRRVTEAPHIYKKDGYYYLFCAEGGTQYNHCETVLRSKNIWGPYELSPYSPIVTSLPYPQNPLQKAGHASIVEAGNGKWYLAHLCSRPIDKGEDRYCILGRETALQEMVWENDWPRLAGGSNMPVLSFEVDDLPGACDEETEKIAKSPLRTDVSWADEFQEPEWNLRFQSLRVPMGEKADLTARPGWLRMYGRESLESLFEQSLLAARQQHFCCTVDTKVEFTPISYQQMAGLTYYYDDISHYYLYITRDEQLGRVLTMYQKVLNKFTMPIGVGVKLPEDGAVYLRLTVERENAQFWYSLNGFDFEKIGPVLDATVISDDYYRKISNSRFTGAFIGICCQDIAGRGGYADFDYFRYHADE